MGRKTLKTGDSVITKIDRVSNNGNIIAHLPPEYSRNIIHVHNGAIGEFASVEITDSGSPLKGKMIDIVSNSELEYNEMSVREQRDQLKEENVSVEEISDPRLSGLEGTIDKSEKQTIEEIVQDMRVEEIKDEKKTKRNNKFNLTRRKL